VSGVLAGHEVEYASPQTRGAGRDFFVDEVNAPFPRATFWTRFSMPSEAPVPDVQPVGTTGPVPNGAQHRHRGYCSDVKPGRPKLSYHDNPPEGTRYWCRADHLSWITATPTSVYGRCRWAPPRVILRGPAPQPITDPRPRRGGSPERLGVNIFPHLARTAIHPDARRSTGTSRKYNYHFNTWNHGRGSRIEPEVWPLVRTRCSARTKAVIRGYLGGRQKREQASSWQLAARPLKPDEAGSCGPAP